MARQRNGRALSYNVKAETTEHSPIGIVDSPFLTLDEGARFCRFDACQDPVVAFRKWLRRNAVPVRKRGRKLLVERRVLLAAMDSL